MTAAPRPTHDVHAIAELFVGHRVVVLTGAGCSTESGIPDYRGPAGTFHKRRPIQYLTFVQSEQARQRYWMRSAVGWRTFSAAHPNGAHKALAALERGGHIHGLVTQNVDGLHQAGGSAQVLELHGSLHRVVCLGCGKRFSRLRLQEELLARNPWLSSYTAEVAPDGDAELDLQEPLDVPACAECGGVLKPDVVFFGENVPPARVATAWQWVGAAEALVVVGSSLTVWSGYRFVRGASERGVPVGIINQGATRADELAAVRVDARAGEALPALAVALGSTRT